MFIVIFKMQKFRNYLIHFHNYLERLKMLVPKNIEKRANKNFWTFLQKFNDLLYNDEYIFLMPRKF